MKMLGIITPDGLQAWKTGQSKHIEDYSRGFIDSDAGTVLVTTNLNLFSYILSTDDVSEVLAAGGTAIAPYPADLIDTNLSTKNRSPNAPCIYTQFGVKIEEKCIFDATGVGEDITIDELESLAHSVLVEVFLGSTTDAFDRCLLPQCPPGYGVAPNPLATADLALMGAKGYGPLDMDGCRPLPIPFPVGEASHIGMVLNMKQHAGCYILGAVHIGVRGFFRGVKGTA